MISTWGLGLGEQGYVAAYGMGRGNFTSTVIVPSSGGGGGGYSLSRYVKQMPRSKEEDVDKSLRTSDDQELLLIFQMFMAIEDE